MQAGVFLGREEQTFRCYKRGMFTHRLATQTDIPVLKTLMHAAIRGLLPQFLPPEKVEASFAVMGAAKSTVTG